MAILRPTNRIHNFAILNIFLFLTIGCHSRTQAQASGSVCPGSCMNKCGQLADIKSDDLSHCHCDHACWLYGDCCIDYYHYCLGININATDDKILTASLEALQNYSAVLNFHENFKWSRLSSCFNLINTPIVKHFQVVSKCSSEEEILDKFAAVHGELSDPLSDNTELFTGLSKVEIKQRCERKVPRDVNKHVLDQTHVSSSPGATVHFYNVFCAICNGLYPRQVSAWTVNVTCDSKTFNQSDTNLLFSDSFDQAVTSNNCTIQNIANSTHQLRSCFPYKHYASYGRNVSSISPAIYSVGSFHNRTCCQPSPDLSSTLCKRYLFPYLDSIAHRIYKNPDCFKCSAGSTTMNPSNLTSNESTKNWFSICRTLNQHDCQCLKFINVIQIIFPNFYVKDHPPVLVGKPAIPSYRLLLDFQSRQTTLTINETTRTMETKSCPQGQVYVPLVDTCRRVNCMPGTRWQDNKCVPVNACPKMASKVNKTCHRDRSPTFDYSYLPFPDGNLYISLDISLEYIFGRVAVSHAAQVEDLTANTLDGLYIGTTSNPNSNPQNKKKSKVGKSEKCLVLSNSLSHLFEVSSLKKMWVEQKKINNSTKLTQAMYNHILKKVRRLIAEIVNVHTRNQSLKVETIFCSGSPCLRGNLPLPQTSNHSYKRPPHNPCLVSPMRQPESQQRVQRSYECLSFGIHLKSSADLDVVLKLARVMFTDIMTVAHDNNFLVSRAKLTNILDDRSDQPTREAETKTSQGNDEGFITNSSQLCQPEERVTFKETNVELSQNGTHIVHFNGHETPLGAFSFRTELDVYSMMSEGEIKATNISWCQTDLSKLQCESMQYEVYNSSNFVFVNGTLVLTNMAETFTQFLGNVSTRMTTLDKLVSLFPKMFAGGNATIVKEGQYIATRSEVLACSNFSNTYQQENETFHTSTRFVFMSDSEEEIIATMLSSVISITCLTGTLAVYSFLPSLQNVPGKIVMSLSAALVCAQILFLTCQKPEGLACEIYAAFHHAAWLASFSWLTALSVDLAYILNCQSSMNCDTSRNNIFKFLSAVCWGVPLMFSGICFVLFKTHFVSMGYGQNGVCWIGNMQSLLLAFGVPVFVIIAVTSGCAVAVVKAIGNSVSFRSRSTSSRRKSRKQVIVCVNLCLLMGFTWLFYFLAVGVGNTVLWALHSFVNGSQGLYIFLCFVARKSLMLKLVTKLKLINIWSRKPDHAGESSKAKMAATITTPTSSP